jgi:Bor protein
LIQIKGRQWLSPETTIKTGADPKSQMSRDHHQTKFKMKTRLLKLVAGSLLCMVMMSSCYTYTTMVGEGAKGTTEVKEWNTYFLFGLIPANTADAKVMAAGAKDYNVKTQQTFVNGLLYCITFGIYTPTTTTVTK